MKLLNTIFPLLLASITTTAQTTPYTDPKTAITYQAFTDPSGYTFGLSLPQAPSTDFIGLLIGKATGWAGVSLGESMVNKLLIAAWADGNTVTSSFRRTGAYDSPPTTTGPFKLTPLANGTWTNSTHFSLTFRCTSCIQSDGSTFAANDTNAVLGWAMSGTAPTGAGNASTVLAYHENMGNYGVDLGAARAGAKEKKVKREERQLYRFQGINGKAE